MYFKQITLSLKIIKAYFVFRLNLNEISYLQRQNCLNIQHLFLVAEYYNRTNHKYQS